MIEEGNLEELQYTAGLISINFKSTNKKKNKQKRKQTKAKIDNKIK